jgi:hypothetical protein
MVGKFVAGRMGFRVMRGLVVFVGSGGIFK